MTEHEHKPFRAVGNIGRLTGEFTHLVMCKCGEQIGKPVIGFNDYEADECCPQCGLILDAAHLYSEPHERADKPGVACKFVRTYDVRFFEDDIVDGDFPRDDEHQTITDCTADEYDTAIDQAVSTITSEGLRCEGSNWFSDPDGSQMNYSTGKRSERSMHLYGFTEEEAGEIIRRVNER